ncbi:hypothetical protein CBLAS_0175 [Campylobacter blaseri]|uniref:Phosphatidylglycerophosphate synthase n=1 Tax=Campylobacter blaseri TaxID=2042961 RepID=A0A2P8R104_9BACT|nr:hypothetical protein [Campylobacter blaseri]PSM52182.1 hypothetical protein CQ405_03775 [Campylobacter blaseri]PSM53948.1 hypothetical protein CRN67_03775 [Campylobacter blaseri]QKF85385.1 hypothetical protein CBLAS_0175 [Campylobacter blaseri]
MDEKKVVNSLDKIKEIGINEVARETHIEPEYIQFIVDKNYDELKSKNAKCFIKILEREYGLDLDEWIEEYNTHNSEYYLKDSGPVFSNSIKQKEIVIKEGRKFPTFLIWILILAVLIFVVFKFELYNFENYFSKNTQSVNIYQNNTTPMVKEVENKLENIGIIANNEEYSETKEDNDTKLNALEIAVNLEQNTTLNEDENLTLDDNSELIADDNLAKDEVTIASKGVSIIPSENMWIGIIDLKSGNKSTLTTDKEYKIDLSKEQLILTGHGLFSLDIDGEKETFKNKNPYRLHIKNGKVKKITYDEFVKLNKGKAW